MHRHSLSWVASLLFVGLLGLGCGEDEPTVENKNPTLTGPTAPATQLEAGASVALTVQASDPDGDTLTYAWDQTAPASPTGTFSSTSVSNPTWTAPTPSTTGPFTLRVTVSDGKGGSAQGTVTLTVIVAQPGNQAPTVSASITGPAALKAGDTGSFSITASDPDGDALTYSWEQTAPAAQGTWVGSRTGSSAQWFSPAVGAQTSFTLSVSVTDNKSAPVVRTLTVPVSVPLYSDVQSVWNTVPSCTACHGTNGGLSLAAGSSHGNLVDVTAQSGACNTLKRVTPGDPDNSVLIRKLEGTTCGSRMPVGDPTYFSQHPGLLVRIRSWILGGALNN
ncbi:MAG: cadherin-like domain-containing protein [Myxococcaceae bacterium]|nr:cadherin-like domain-containing protein [Myxococcaceae bacterium]